jgi:hypothetical protein
MSTKINYIIDPKNGEKLLPFQYYQLNNLITIPILTNDKRPFIKGWNNTKETIYPTDINQNIGILTGKINNLTVLDIDIKNNGLRYWKEISKDYKEIKTPMTKTPSGGLHIYFKYNKNIQNFNRITINGEKIGWDCIGDNRQVVVYPSIINEIKYKWIKNKSLDDVKICIMPKWLEKILLENMK